MNITVRELKKRIEEGDKDFVLIDVREEFEREEFNIGGEHIPLGDIMGALNRLEPFRDKEVIIYCRSDKRSGLAQNLLQQFGFQKVFNLTGGMLAWQKL